MTPPLSLSLPAARTELTMTTEPTIDPREIPNLCERLAVALPDLCERILAAAEADPAFRALCRAQGVEGGVTAAFHAAQQAIDEAR